MSRRQQPKRAAKAVKNLIEAIDSDVSDFEELYESSGDDFKPKKADDCSSGGNSSNSSSESSSQSDNEPLSKLKVKFSRKKRPLTPRNEESSDSDRPLSTYRQAYPNDKENRAGTVVSEVREDDIDDLDLADVLPAIQTAAQPIQSEYKWRKQEFTVPDTTFKGKLEEAPRDERLMSPYEFFRKLLTDEMLDNIVDQTNRYAMQKEGIQLCTTSKEIEIMIGMYLRMGLVQMPRVRAYWEAESRYAPIADTMARNRFEKISSDIHFTDNLNVTTEQRNDKLWKIRPWISALRGRFLTIPPEENHSVDEIMVSFKGKHSIKQYIRGKPNPWGFKMWGRAGASGILYDFDIYQGSAAEKPQDSLGVGGDVVIKLASTLEPNKNYKLFADNFFTSLPMVKALKAQSIWYVGTVRSNRLKGCTLKVEKELKKEGRGAVDYQVETSSNIIALRWYDNKSVDVVSSYVGIEPAGEVRRWDKRSRQYIFIPRPNIIATYNMFMGGVDTLDSLTSLYKQKMKSRRWYMYIFWHTIMITVVNAWLWYKRHCVLLHQNPVKLATFISSVVSGLIECRAKVGRPTLSPPPVPKSLVIKSCKRPADDSRVDCLDHFPIWDTKRQRCKFFNCSDSFSFIKCMKCNVHLCLNKERNCFTAFHM